MLLFPDKKDAVLVQIVEMMEIGHPAHDLLKRHEARMEDRKMMKTEGRTVRRADMRTEGTQPPEGDTAGTQAQINNAADAIPLTKFPRHMLKLTVSDGFTTCYAIEVKRMNDLNLEDTDLGCKVSQWKVTPPPALNRPTFPQLLLRGVKSRHGMLMLEPANCTVKGGFASDLNARRDAVFTAALLQRLGYVPGHEVVQSTKPIWCSVEGDDDEAELEQNDMLVQAAPNPSTHVRAPRSVASRTSTTSAQTSNSGRTVSTKATTARSESAKPAARTSHNTAKIPHAAKMEDDPYDALLSDDVTPDELAALDQLEQCQKIKRDTQDNYDSYLNDDDIDEDAEAMLAEIEMRSQRPAAPTARRNNVVEIPDSSDAEVQGQLVASSDDKRVAPPPKKKKARGAPQRRGEVIDLD